VTRVITSRPWISYLGVTRLHISSPRLQKWPIEEAPSSECYCRSIAQRYCAVHTDCTANTRTSRVIKVEQSCHDQVASTFSSEPSSRTTDHKHLSSIQTPLPSPRCLDSSRSQQFQRRIRRQTVNLSREGCACGGSLDDGDWEDTVGLRLGGRMCLHVRYGLWVLSEVTTYLVGCWWNECDQ
jgi:hypothetical protein